MSTLFILQCVVFWENGVRGVLALGHTVAEPRFNRKVTAEHQVAEVLLVPALVLNQHHATVNAVR